MNYKVLVAAFLAASVVGVASGGIGEPPRRWASSVGEGEGGSSCVTGVDSDLRAAGQRNLSIQCDPENTSLASLRQGFLASPYWGKQVRFSAWVRAAGIDETAGMDDESGGAGAGIFIVHSDADGDHFYPMTGPALTGWTDWVYREVVVDVPGQGQWLNIGLWLRGPGQAWLRDPAFEIVSDSSMEIAGGAGQ